MGKTTIRVELDERSVTEAIRELEQYRSYIRRKEDEYRVRMASELADMVDRNFSSAEVYVSSDERRPAQVTVVVSDIGNISVVYAVGEDAVWCEFGAGVYYNGSAGSSPNPLAKNASTDVTIGSYGAGRGKQTAWGYYGNPETKTGLTITRGTPAQMPMYHAVQELLTRSIDIAREVFR